MASILTRDFFLTLFDEFSGVPFAKIDAYIEMASARVSPRVWGDKAKHATALLTAHLLHSTAGKGGAGSGAGALNSETVGSVSRSFGSMGVAGTDDAYNASSYGREFIALRNATIQPGTMTGGPFGVPGRGIGWTRGELG